MMQMQDIMLIIQHRPQTECAIGTYQSNSGQSSCLDADAGHYVDSTGSDSQTECAVGTYQSATGQHLV